MSPLIDRLPPADAHRDLGRRQLGAGQVLIDLDIAASPLSRFALDQDALPATSIASLPVAEQPAVQAAEVMRLGLLDSACLALLPHRRRRDPLAGKALVDPDGWPTCDGSQSPQRHHFAGAFFT